LIEVDHIKPVFEGGDNDILNLTTACFDCNRGKGKRELKDESVIKKQHKQLEELQEKRNQLELMMKWKKELSKLDDVFIKYIEQCIESFTNLSWVFNDSGKSDILKLRKKFTDSEIVKALDVSFSQYYKFPDSEKDQTEQWSKAVNYIPKILNVQKSQENHPYLKDLFYCRVILRNKSYSINEWEVLAYLKSMITNGWEVDEIKDLCITSNSWKHFYQRTCEEDNE